MGGELVRRGRLGRVRQARRGWMAVVHKGRPTASSEVRPWPDLPLSQTDRPCQTAARDRVRGRKTETALSEAGPGARRAESVEAASALILPLWRTGVTVETKSDESPVTEADQR